MLPPYDNCRKNRTVKNPGIFLRDRNFLQTCLGVPGTGSFRKNNEKMVYSYGLVQTEFNKCFKSRKFTPLGGIHINTVFAQVFYNPLSNSSTNAVFFHLISDGLWFILAGIFGPYGLPNSRLKENKSPCVNESTGIHRRRVQTFRIYL